MNWKRPFRGLHFIAKPRKQATCPRCDAIMTDLYEIGPAAPKPGSFTICWQCSEVLRFNARLELHILNERDCRTLDLNPQTRTELDQLRIQIVVATRIKT